jgi:hypothetical protein
VDETHDKGRTPRMQEQNALFPQDFDDGEFPQTGRFSIDRWAKKLKCCRKTIEREIALNHIPHTRAGGKIWIEAEDYWTSSLKVNHAEGKRRR